MQLCRLGPPSHDPVCGPPGLLAGASPGPAALGSAQLLVRPSIHAQRCCTSSLLVSPAKMQQTPSDCVHAVVCALCPVGTSLPC